MLETRLALCLCVEYVLTRWRFYLHLCVCVVACCVRASLSPYLQVFVLVLGMHVCQVTYRMLLVTVTCC